MSKAPDQADREAIEILKGFVTYIEEFGVLYAPLRDIKKAKAWLKDQEAAL